MNAKLDVSKHLSIKRWRICDSRESALPHVATETKVELERRRKRAKDEISSRIC